MLKSWNKIFRNPIIWGLFILILTLIVSYSVREQDFKKMGGARNLEASYHILLTVSALSESSAEHHWYLPTVSLGREQDKNIPWGATVPTQTGDYIYTSFTPLGFLVPFIWIRAFDLEPSITNLAHLNFILGCLSTLALFLLLVDVLKFHEYGVWTSVSGAIVGSIIGIFSREALTSHGVIYWSHSLYQLILISSLFSVFKWLSSESNESRSLYAVATIVASFAGPLTEWTGYVFNVGLILLLWSNNRDTAFARELATKILIATAIAGILTVVHFSLAVGFGPTIVSFGGRFLARNATAGSFVELLQGYRLSYGLFILSILSIFATYAAPFRWRQPAILIFIAACIPLLENVLLLQHATQFSFDRLKFIFPASMILAFSFARLEAKGRVILSVVILLSSLHGYKSYKADMSDYSSWGPTDIANRKLASRIKSRVDVGCAVFSTNLRVRGYANVLFHRGIYEDKSIAWITELSAKTRYVCPPEAVASEEDVGYCPVSSANLGLLGYAKLLLHRGIYDYKYSRENAEFLAKRSACASVYLEGMPMFPDLPKYLKATIRYKDGTTEEISSDLSKGLFEDSEH